ncbi:thiolase family protein [Nostoc sphaeroides CCNUC1]|uniref:Thiolase family protein n=1 Tax=Nostoc sphaeroides CCNUC1 TaxID=2653204 RepID=A0A5P8W5A0_9NOSO|nr:thiolase family protein [Nostoc sphaeroides CCNUC1]
MEEAYIVSAVRTPLGKFGGVLADLSPVVIDRSVKPVSCLSPVRWDWETIVLIPNPYFF